jgi:hypothetical protein
MRKSIHPSWKSSGILNELSFDEAEVCINQITEEIRSSVSDVDFQIGEVTDITKYYNVSEITATPIPWLEKNSMVDEQQLVGQVVGMKGSHLITRIQNAFTIANIQKLIGYTIDSEREIKAVTQSGLLDYF